MTSDNSGLQWLKSRLRYKDQRMGFPPAIVITVFVLTNSSGCAASGSVSTSTRSANVPGLMEPLSALKDDAPSASEPRKGCTFPKSVPYANSLPRVSVR